jgi:hypothetical protein
MADNFEEQFLLFLVPYDRTDIHYVTPPGRPDLLANVPVLPSPFADADGWTKAVRSDIMKIAGSKVGSHLLRSIKFHGQVITIRPKQADDCNSVTGEGFNVSNSADLSVGTGADVIYNPGTYATGGKCQAKSVAIGGYSTESHEVLFHELVHAFRHVSGKLNKTVLGKGLSFYENNEEFDAVLMQGIYASERRRPVRSSHFKHFEIDKELNSSMRFFKSGEETFNWVEKFCMDNPGFTRGIAEIDLAFNPINSYYYDREIVRKLGRSSTASRRDKLMPTVKAVVDFLRNELR